MLKLEELLWKIGKKLKEVPYIDKLMSIKGIVLVMVSRFIVEVEILDVLITPNNCRS